MIRLAILLAACSPRSDDSGPAPSPDTSGDTAAERWCARPLASGGLDEDCNGTAARTVPLADAAHLEVLGVVDAQLGEDLACSDTPVGAFTTAISVGGPEGNTASTYGWAVLVSGDRTGRIGVAESDLVVRGSQVSDRLGSRVAFPGDVDGDGHADWVTSGFTAERPSATEGAAFLYTAPAPGTLVPEDATAHFRGGEPGVKFGGAARAGDLDGDGRAELLLSATAWGDTGFVGDIRIYPGADFSGEITPDAAAVTFGAADVVSPTGWVMRVGDLVGGDGIPDLATTEHAWQNGQGRVLVVAGPLLAGPPRDLDDAAVVLEGEAEHTSTASQVVSGDLNADGQADLVVSAPVADGPMGPRAGRAYVFFGPLEPGTRSVATADVTIEAETEHAWLSNGLAILDHDGDGTLDLAVAATSDYYFARDRPGVIYVFPGPLAAGPLDPATDAAVVYQDDLIGAMAGERMEGCDLDGDGDDELVIGSPQASFSEEEVNAGRVHVVAGGPWRDPA